MYSKNQHIIEPTGWNLAFNYPKIKGPAQPQTLQKKKKKEKENARTLTTRWEQPSSHHSQMPMFLHVTSSIPNKEQKHINLQVQTISKTFEELLQHPTKYSSYKKRRVQQLFMSKWRSISYSASNRNALASLFYGCTIANANVYPLLRINITRNRGHFEPVNNCQRYIMLLSRTIRSNMAALIALSERKRVSYDLL